MKAVGYYDTNNMFCEFGSTIDVYEKDHKTLWYQDNSGVFAIKDDHGHWVNPQMYSMGVKVRLEVVDGATPAGEGEGWARHLMCWLHPLSRR